MNKLFLGLFGLATIAAYGAPDRDRSGAYRCHCQGIDCENDFTFHYDRQTLFISAEGPKWKISGYALRQESKGDRVFLTLPRGEWLPSVSVTFLDEGRARTEPSAWVGGNMLCTRIGD